MMFHRFVCSLFVLLLCPVQASSNDFEPYQLNGGLVAAVAGRDYCIIATDTRFMDGGYEIYTRRHTSSRLWCADASNKKYDNMIADAMKEKNTNNGDTTSNQVSCPPVWIASAGCSADCEALKRLIQHEMSALSHFQQQLEQPSVVTTLLSQVLYRRRTFPFYSFCVVAGLLDNGGAVYQYDAIGSYEQVAVATSGTGRELLQPILDRLFFSSKEEKEAENDSALVKKMLPPRVVPTHVDCSHQEAIDVIVRAYQSVSEREIGVGDNLVLCVTQNNAVRVVRVPLKRH